MGQILSMSSKRRICRATFAFSISLCSAHAVAERSHRRRLRKICWRRRRALWSGRYLKCLSVTMLTITLRQTSSLKDIAVATRENETLWLDSSPAGSCSSPIGIQGKGNDTGPISNEMPGRDWRKWLRAERIGLIVLVV